MTLSPTSFGTEVPSSGSFSGQINTSPAANLRHPLPSLGFKNVKILKIHNIDKNEITVL
jgi:hypothetical protein